VTDFLVWLLEHWHTIYFVTGALVVGGFLVRRHRAEVLPENDKSTAAAKARKRDAALAANEFLLVAVLVLTIGLAARIEQVSSIDVAEIKRHQVSTDTSLASVNEKLGRIAESLPASRQFEVLSDYEAFVRCIEREVKRTQGRWLITRIQLQQATTKQEDGYFNAMVSRLEKEEIRDCRRIVRVESKEHLSRYVDLLKRLSGVPYFGLAIWRPDETPFNYEMLIGDDVVILAYGAGAPSWGIRIPDKGTADRFATTFDYMWTSQNATEIIKPLRPLSEARLHDAIERLRQVYEEHLNESPAQPKQ
jgi:hypothetical protein